MASVLQSYIKEVLNLYNDLDVVFDGKHESDNRFLNTQRNGFEVNIGVRVRDNNDLEKDAVVKFLMSFSNGQPYRLEASITNDLSNLKGPSDIIVSSNSFGDVSYSAMSKYVLSELPRLFPLKTDRGEVVLDAYGQPQVDTYNAMLMADELLAKARLHLCALFPSSWGAMFRKIPVVADESFGTLAMGLFNGKFQVVYSPMFCFTSIATHILGYLIDHRISKPNTGIVSLLEKECLDLFCFYLCHELSHLNRVNLGLEGHFSDEDREIMKTHPEFGTISNIVADSVINTNLSKIFCKESPMKSGILDKMPFTGYGFKSEFFDKPLYSAVDNLLKFLGDYYNCSTYNRVDSNLILSPYYSITLIALNDVFIDYKVDSSNAIVEDCWKILSRLELEKPNNPPPPPGQPPKDDIFSIVKEKLKADGWTDDEVDALWEDLSREIYIKTELGG